MNNTDRMLSEMSATIDALRAQVEAQAGVIEAANAWWRAHNLYGSYGDFATCVQDYELVAALAAQEEQQQEGHAE